MPIVVLQMTCGHRWLEFACQHQLGYAILCLSVSMNMNGWTKSKQGSHAENNGKTIAVCSWIQLVPARFCWCLVVPCCHPLRLCSLAMLELGPGSADCGHLEGVLACIIRGQQAHRFFAKWGIQQWCLASVYRSKLKPSQDTSLWTDSARGIVGLHSTKARVRAYECTTWTLSWWRMLMDAEMLMYLDWFSCSLQCCSTVYACFWNQALVHSSAAPDAQSILTQKARRWMSEFEACYAYNKQIMKQRHFTLERFLYLVLSVPLNLNHSYSLPLSN